MTRDELGGRALVLRGRARYLPRGIPDLPRALAASCSRRSSPTTRSCSACAFWHRMQERARAWRGPRHLSLQGLAPAAPRCRRPRTGPRPRGAHAMSVTQGEPIVLKDGRMVVPDQPGDPVHRGRRHRPGHLARVGARARRARWRRPTAASAASRWHEVLAGQKAFDQTGNWLPDRHARRVPRLPRRHQGPAHDAGRRRHPLAQRRAAADPRPRTCACARCAGSRACPRRSSRRRRWTW